jgi:L-ascorbate metabolism protein UlaG (beta-lactamase superfamily)
LSVGYSRLVQLDAHRLLGLLLCVLPQAGCSSSQLLRETEVRVGPLTGGLQITWLGTAGVLISDGESSFFIDPFVTRPGMLAVATGAPIEPRVEVISALIRRLHPPNVGAVLVSHSHYDHSMDAPFFAWRTGAPLVGSQSTLNVGRGALLPEGRLRVIRPGDVLRVGRFQITVLQSEHGSLFGRVPYPGEISRPLRPPASASRYRLGETFSLLIEHGSTRLLHHGSAGCYPPALVGVRADVVLLGLAGRRDTARYLREVVGAVGARLVIPLHYDNFFEPLDEPLRLLPTVRFAEFVQTARRSMPALRIATLPLGQTVALPDR